VPDLALTETLAQIAEYALAAGGECAMSEPHRPASSGAVPLGMTRSWPAFPRSRPSAATPLAGPLLSRGHEGLVR
jgi:hypothetical protein